MRVTALLGVLCLLAAPVMAEPMTYSMEIDDCQSSLGIYIGLYMGTTPENPDPLWTIDTYDSSSVGGTMTLQVDEEAGTAEMLAFEAGLTGNLTLFLDLSPVSGGAEVITVQIDSPWPGIDPIALLQTGSGGGGQYDADGNIVFPDVEAAVTGGGYYTGIPGGFSIPSLLGALLGVADDTPGEESYTGIVDLGNMGIELSDDIPAIVTTGVCPTVTIPLDISGYDEAIPNLWVLYGVDGTFVAKCVPVSVAIDIKPGTAPNDLNRRAGGKLPVQILTDGDVDADTVQISLGCASVAPSHTQANDDGMICQFVIQDLVAGLDLGSCELGEVELTVTANLVDGTSIRGTDVVVIVK
jgi:hypothetical protein